MPDRPPLLRQRSDDVREYGFSKVVLVGDVFQDDYDAEVESTDRLAVGLLGEAVRDKWACSGCRTNGGPTIGCVAYVEHYVNGQGSTFALCENCLRKRLARGLTDAA
jgi:hypothetical protein